MFFRAANCICILEKLVFNKKLNKHNKISDLEENICIIHAWYIDICNIFACLYKPIFLHCYFYIRDRSIIFTICDKFLFPSHGSLGHSEFSYFKKPLIKSKSYLQSAMSCSFGTLMLLLFHYSLFNISLQIFQIT